MSLPNCPFERELPRPAWIRETLGNPSGKGIRIGVIDSGWARNIIQPKIQHGVGLVAPEDDFSLSLSNDDCDRNGHGTGCASLICRIAPASEIVPIRIFNERLNTSVPVLEAAIYWAVEQRLSLVNLSLGTHRRDALSPLYRACEWAHSQGLIMVAASHNMYGWSFPSMFDNVISVGVGNVPDPFSYYYRANHAVECLSKGQDQYVLGLSGKFFKGSATSFAAPNISGIVALLLECYPGASLERIRELLEHYALPGRKRRGDLV